jgi:hypothetical protein
MPTPCTTCPFSWSEEAQIAQAIGCLPSPYDIIEIKRTTNENWACHSNCKRICQGLVQANDERKLGLDLTQGPLHHDFESVHSLTNTDEI